MWRPKNWNAKEIANGFKVPSGFLGLEWYVEAGAEAILEALKQNAVLCKDPYNTLLVDAVAPKMIELNCKGGTLVLIPDGN